MKLSVHLFNTEANDSTARQMEIEAAEGDREESSAECQDEEPPSKRSRWDMRPGDVPESERPAHEEARSEECVALPFSHTLTQHCRSDDEDDDDEERRALRRAARSERRAERLRQRAKEALDEAQAQDHAALERQKPTITVLKGERRIIIKRNNEEDGKRKDNAESGSTVGTDEDKAAEKVRQAAYNRISQRRGEKSKAKLFAKGRNISVEASVRMTLLMEKLHDLSKREKPMVNPFSVPSAVADQAQEVTGESCDRNSIEFQYNLLAGDETHVEQEEHEVYVYQRPPGRPYELETGELPPPGVVMPPPGMENEPPILLPLAMREWIPQV